MICSRRLFIALLYTATFSHSTSAGQYEQSEVSETWKMLTAGLACFGWYAFKLYTTNSKLRTAQQTPGTDARQNKLKVRCAHHFDKAMMASVFLFCFFLKFNHLMNESCN